MHMQSPRLFSIHTGKIAPLGPEGVPSGFVKQRVDGPVNVTALGLQGDEQVIVNPQDSIVDGAPVRVVPAKSGSESGSDPAASASAAHAGSATSAAAQAGSEAGTQPSGSGE